MNIKICSNIVRLRKENKMTQAQVAEYLSVSPQAVSKWEQEAAMPDVYLLPRIAFLFNVSLDTLFGTCNMDATELLVSKYSTLRNDHHYKEAKEAVNTLIALDDKNLESIALLCHLEYQRSLEYLNKSKEACHQLLELSVADNAKWTMKANRQMMRIHRMLGDYQSIEEYMSIFESNQLFGDFMNLLIILEEYFQYEEMLRWGDEYLERFTKEESKMICLRLLKASKEIKDANLANEYYQRVTDNNDCKEDVFQATWMMWELNKALDKKATVEAYKNQLLELLEGMCYDAYTVDKMVKALNE